MVTTLVGFSQNNPINFESGGFGDAWTWTVFENDTNPPLEIVANPDPTGINTSSTVAKFTALQSGMPFAGVESMHGSDIGTFTLNSENAIVSIKVWKSTISDVGIKFATPSGASTGEIKVPNTLVNQWERLVFDFTGIIGAPSSTGIDQIIVFPDFIARTQDNIIYWDDIIFGEQLGINDIDQNSIRSFPNPVTDNWNIQGTEIINRITVYNVIGQEKFTVKPNDLNYSLDVSGLMKGLYIAKVTTATASKTIKIVKL
jgi:hypothetical protein